MIVDGNNVMGSTADGWWQDRQGAVARLASRLVCHEKRTGERLVLVLDVPHPDLPEDGGELTVRYPRRRGRDAADERILELLDDHPGTVDAVVTSDRALAEAVRRRGVPVTGARTFLSGVERAGC